jgi:hypothetical protein
MNTDSVESFEYDPENGLSEGIEASVMLRGTETDSDDADQSGTTEKSLMDELNRFFS